jgi:small subunit ribosomal protein S9
MAETPANANSPLAGIKVPAPAGQPSQKPQTKDNYTWATGRRKTSVARVRISPGKGELKINNRELGKYFTRPQDINNIMAPLKATKTEKGLDIHVNVNGGGITGQSGAIMLGIARALKIYDPTLLPALRDGGFLTRDGRMVERKKPGQSGARRRYQFSKR